MLYLELDSILPLLILFSLFRKERYPTIQYLWIYWNLSLLLLCHYSYLISRHQELYPFFLLSKLSWRMLFFIVIYYIISILSNIIILSFIIINEFVKILIYFTCWYWYFTFRMWTDYVLFFLCSVLMAYKFLLWVYVAL